MVVSPPASGRGSEGERKEQEEEQRKRRKRGEEGEERGVEGSKAETRGECEGPANILHLPSPPHPIFFLLLGGLS